MESSDRSLFSYKIPNKGVMFQKSIGGNRCFPYQAGAKGSTPHT